MDDLPIALTTPPEGYAAWLADLKGRIYATQQRAAHAVNTELLRLYWQIGHEILVRQAEQGWGTKVVERLAHDLRAEFPEMSGFSRSTCCTWTDDAIVQQAVGQLPWGHNLVLLTKLKEREARLAYGEAAVRHGWSRNILTMQIETRVLDRQGAALTNFELALPPPQSDLARESLKDRTGLTFWA
jgi:predicted nuclease of restriction endonuclease-like (RecB) superfamily